MDLKSQRKIAARILKCGESRIWLNPARSAEISEAITADDIRRLIKDGIVKKKKAVGTSRVRARKIQSQKKKGRRRGHGSRKGKRTAKKSRKEEWMALIRALRRMLRELKNNRSIENSTYRKMYQKAGGGFFRSRSHLKLYLEQQNLLKNEALEKVHSKTKR